MQYYICKCRETHTHFFRLAPPFSDAVTGPVLAFPNQCVVKGGQGQTDPGDLLLFLVILGSGRACIPSRLDFFPHLLHQALSNVFVQADAAPLRLVGAKVLRGSDGVIELVVQLNRRGFMHEPVRWLMVGSHLGFGLIKMLSDVNVVLAVACSHNLVY